MSAGPSDIEHAAINVPCKVSAARLRAMRKAADDFGLPTARGYESLLLALASFGYGEIRRAVASNHHLIDYIDPEDWVEFTETESPR